VNFSVTSLVFPSLFLELHRWVVLKITHVDFLSLLNHIRVFLAHQPTNMREEESATRIVGISVCVCVLVVDSMIPRPLKNWMLTWHGLQKQQKHLQFLVCLEGFVGEISMSANSRSKTSSYPNCPTNDQSRSRFWNDKSIDPSDVKVDEHQNIQPLDLKLILFAILFFPCAIQACGDTEELIKFKDEMCWWNLRFSSSATPGVWPSPESFSEVISRNFGSCFLHQQKEK
jgi:hypothetical protein